MTSSRVPGGSPRDGRSKTLTVGSTGETSLVGVDEAALDSAVEHRRLTIDRLVTRPFRQLPEIIEDRPDAAGDLDRARSVVANLVEREIEEVVPTRRRDNDSKRAADVDEAAGSERSRGQASEQIVKLVEALDGSGG